MHIEPQTAISRCITRKQQLTIMTMELHIPRLESCSAPVANAVSIDSTSCTNLWPSKAATDGCVMDAFEPKSQRQARDTKVQRTLSSLKWETLHQKTSITVTIHRESDKVWVGKWVWLCGCMWEHACNIHRYIYACTPTELYLCASMIS